METQLRMYLAGTIAAVAAFLFVSLAFSGQFNFIHGGVYIVFFIHCGDGRLRQLRQVGRVARIQLTELPEGCVVKFLY